MPKFIKVKCIVEKVESECSSKDVNTYEDFEEKINKEFDLISIDSFINIDGIESWNEFVNDDSSIDKNLTMLQMKSGNSICVAYPFIKFEELFYDWPIIDLMKETK